MTARLAGTWSESRSAADQVLQKLVALWMPGECCRGRVLPVLVIPQVRKQDVSCLVHRKTGNVLG